MAVLGLWTALHAQNGAPRGPRVELRPAPLLELPGEVDSNSPAVWERVGGRSLLFVIMSMSGLPSRAWGRDLTMLGVPRQTALDPWPSGGVWMEAVVKDDGATWYGYYHNEIPANMCRSTAKVVPRIGAARSRDRGATWEPLGVVLEAPPRAYDCTTENAYFVGGVGDFSVQLDAESQDLYFMYSLYLRDQAAQGVGVARLAWADRDDPAGKIMIWRNHSWVPATAIERDPPRYLYPAASPIFPAAESWHDDDQVVDAFWGPSVHWNTHLEKYVMLLNRARDGNYRSEGIYVSFSESLDDPGRWSPPVKILSGGDWYPQVVGLEAGLGTDKVAGEWARFFIRGTSQHLIRFVP